MNSLFLKKTGISASLLLSVTFVTADTLSLATKPLYTGATDAPMMMLTMGRDHTLFYEAYNDASDLNGDGVLDLNFMPDYDYEGYFNVDACYEYDNSNTFNPVDLAASDDRVCNNSTSPWSGNFLNYLTMTRMDVLRKVLYGGTRSTDSETKTILERVYIPQDAHSWAKSYESENINGYDLRDYTPYELPNYNKAHFFGSVTYTSDTSAPILRVRENADVSSATAGVWDWASTERPVLKASGTDFEVKVQVCGNTTLLENNCKLYPSGNYKPTGLLHDYGESDQMLFGLLTGSYNKNLSGGVLREVIKEFSGEVDSNTGKFTSTDDGIVATINKLKIYGFNYTGSGNNYMYNENCSWINKRSFLEGECVSWGNPIGEMLYESMRYFAGESAASPSYAASGAEDASLGLPTPAWDDPYDGRGTCARPNVLLISDINPSYDSDQLPGAYSEFASTYNGSTLISDDGSNFNITTLLSTISTSEGKTSGEYFIGQSGTNSDGAPTVKSITSLASVRGLAPAEPTKQGSYTSSGVTYYGLTNDVNKGKAEEQNVKTMVVSLASNLPEINVEIDGETVTIVPFAKSVGGSGINKNKGEFQATNTIVDWYAESITSTSGVFQINFEDVEQGGDHDMDMIVKYSYEVLDNVCVGGSCKKGLEITLDSTYAAGGVDQHAGYIISGTTNDGMYLEVKDQGGNEVKYYLDTPISTNYQSRENMSNGDENTLLGFTATRSFHPSSSAAAEFLPSPLWYAAKWGGFNDENDNGKPDLDSEWDEDNDGKPDNYFPVTNAGELKSQLGAAFDLAYDGTVSSTSPVFSSNYLTAGTVAYESSFEEVTWSGDIEAYTAASNGSYPSTPTWSAADQLDSISNISARKIYSRNNESDAVFEFKAPTSLVAATDSFSAGQLSSLLSNTVGTVADKLSYTTAVIDYIRGDRTHEGDTTTYNFRERTSRLGDIINSTPYLVANVNGHDVTKNVLVYGANDGMVHITDADSGEELVAYIPSGVYGILENLPDATYVHEYSVDGAINGYSDYTDTNDVKTTVVGRLGLGAKGLYAIDVSDLNVIDKDIMKWEITASTTGYEGIGYSVAAPNTVQIATGEAAVVFPNGYNSNEDDGAIYFANINDGSLIKKLSVPTQIDPSGLNRPNALAQPAIIDNDVDGIADHIYVGDLFGNMWVFDISDADPDNWALNTKNNKPLFTAYSPTIESNAYLPQSITTRPSVTRHPNGTGILVAFGTGKYVESTDASSEDQATQSFYVIADQLDGNVITATRSTTTAGNTFSNNGNETSILNNLQNQSIVKESSTNRLLSTNPVDWDKVSGFYLDFVDPNDGENHGERQVVNSSLFSNKVSFITLIPNEDTCSAGGTGWYMELNLYTGQTWNLGTPVEDDPLTVEDESAEIPTDSSNQALEGVGTGMTTVISVPDDTDSTDPDNSTSGNSSDSSLDSSTKPSLSNCVRLSTGKKFCYDNKINSTGRLSWRHLY